MAGILPEGYREDFTFAPRHLGTLRFNDAEILTIEEVLDPNTGNPQHGHYIAYLENSITGTKLEQELTFQQIN